MSEVKCRGANVNMSTVYWFTGADEAGAAKSCKPLCHGALQELKTRTMCKTMLDKLRALGEWGGLDFDAYVN